MDVSSIALQGLDQAQVQFDRATAGLSQTAANQLDAPAVDIVELSAAAVAMKGAKGAIDPEIQMLKVANDTQKQVLSLFA